MCGRTVCSLAPEDIIQKCGQFQRKDRKGYLRCKWADSPNGKEYYSSYNVPPTAYTPVLVAADHLSRERDKDVDCFVTPMRWGLVPHWYQGDLQDLKLLLNNARSDGLLQKVSFKGPLEKGRRCVILVDGYYEWKALDKGKQPYFIYFPENVSSLKDQSSVSLGKKGYRCQRMLTMAGIFNERNSSKGCPMYSYTIITVDAHKKYQDIHSRMPAILDGDEQVLDWLDHGSISLSKALELIRPRDCLTCHPVSNLVGNVHNKELSLILPVEVEKSAANSKQGCKLLTNWLKRTPKKEITDDAAVTPKKEDKDEAAGTPKKPRN